MNRRARRILPRRFRGYCIGAAKTGTSSLAAVFRPAYRARHEAEALRTNRLVISYHKGEIGEAEVRGQLQERDRRLRLELESAHPLGYLAPLLAEVFPDARFVVTIREPLSWLRSRLNFHHKISPPSKKAWTEYRDYFWMQQHEGFAPEEEEVLERYGLCSLEVYLRQYAEHYRCVLEGIPAERRLVVRTTEIDERVSEIAAFLGARPHLVDAAHSNRSDDKITPLAEMDEAFVKEQVMQHCGFLVERFFPEKTSSRVQRDGQSNT